MNTYLVSLVFQVHTENHRGLAQFDEQHRIVTAPDIQKAWEKAKDLGKKEESVFVNHRKEIVKWKFLAPSSAFLLDGVEDGGHIYSITHEAEDAGSFEERVREKARFLEVCLFPETMESESMVKELK